MTKEERSNSNNTNKTSNSSSSEQKVPLMTNTTTSAAPIMFPFTLRHHSARFGSSKQKNHRHRSKSPNSKSFELRRVESTRRETSASNLVSQMTLEEKLYLISGRNLWSFGGIERLNIPTIIVADGPHGVRRPVSNDTQSSHPATCFPTACALACSWDRDLCETIGRHLAIECESLGVSLLLGPGMNIKRHPCGGRNFEYLSEDPVLSGQLAAALVSGVQESGKIGACAKHVAVNNQEANRFVVNAICDFRTLRELYAAGFEYCIKKAQPWALMTAYNRLNGIHCSEHRHVFADWVRSELGFGINDADHEGALTPHIVMTDWGAVNDRVKGIAAGVDLEMPGSFGAHDRDVKMALKEGTLKMEDLDACCSRLVQFIERAAKSPVIDNFTDDGDDEESAPDKKMEWVEEHHDLALRAARETIVLLKNERNTLPVAESSSVAIIGQFAKYPRYQGSGSSQVNPTKLESVINLIGNYTDKYTYAEGYHLHEEGIEEKDVDQNLLSEAVDVAQKADICLCFVGLPDSAESEGFDRAHLQMPLQHNRLVQNVVQANPRTIIILSNGGPVEMPWVGAAPGVIETSLSGQASSQAVLDIIFGRSNPCGKLAETFPVKLQDVLSDQYFPGDRQKVEYREGLCVGYRYFDTANKDVLFPFGHGLSYTTFQFSELKTKEIEKNTYELSVLVTNTGQKEGSEVVQCYVNKKKSSVFCPDQELKAFEKVHLAPGESTTVSMTLVPHAFSFYDIGHHQWVLEGGEYEVRIGASSRDVRCKETLNLKAENTIPSEKAIAAYPPVDNPDVTLMDDAFKNRMERSFEDGTRDFDTIYAEFPEDIVHRNSLLCQCQHTFFGRMFRWVLVKEMKKHLEPDAPIDKQMKVINAFADHMPLRALVLFSEGGLTFFVLDWMINCMNGYYWSAFKGVFGIIFGCKFRN